MATDKGTDPRDAERAQAFFGCMNGGRLHDDHAGECIATGTNLQYGCEVMASLLSEVRASTAARVEKLERVAAAARDLVTTHSIGDALVLTEPHSPVIAKNYAVQLLADRTALGEALSDLGEGKP